jgi:hypothetical protein
MLQFPYILQITQLKINIFLLFSPPYLEDKILSCLNTLCVNMFTFLERAIEEEKTNFFVP